MAGGKETSIGMSMQTMSEDLRRLPRGEPTPAVFEGFSHFVFWERHPTTAVSGLSLVLARLDLFFEKVLKM